MIKNKVVIFFLIFLLYFTKISVANISIIASVDGEIITSYDIKKESDYLKILNPNLSQLDNDQIIKLAKKEGISDIHIQTGLPIAIRVNGLIEKIDNEIAKKEDVNKLIKSILTPAQQKRLDAEKSFDVGFTLKGIRFRGNIFESQSGTNIVFRILDEEIRSFSEMNFPPVIEETLLKQNGLILVTGPTGSGKTSSIASMIEYLNQHTQKNIITIEDPIEYIFEPEQSIISQREVGHHALSFQDALRAALREDPDVILVGELRDLETVSLALTAAETGHLVFATLHTSGAANTINRIVDVFPPEQQAQVRQQIAVSLKLAITQRLIRKMDGSSRIPAFEVMVCNVAIQNLIREGKIFQIPNVLQTSSGDGMVQMKQSIDTLKADGIISYDEESE